MNPLKKCGIFSRLLLLTLVLGVVPIVLIAFVLSLPFDLTREHYRYFIGIMLMALPVAALCMTALATKTIKSSLQKLLTAQRRFCSGNLDTRISLDGDRDSVNLYRGFNVMADLVNESFERTLNRERNKALAEQASLVAHDMRSPLSVIKSYTGLEAGTVDADARELKRAARRSVDKLIRMADDLLDYAKAGRVERSREDVGRIICDDVIGEMREAAAEKGVVVTSDIEGNIYATVDRHRIGRVLVNLVTNAIQSIECATAGDPAAGSVSISARAEADGSLVIAVRDNGKGIDGESLPYIFDSFFTKGKKGGTGLGLAYCKQVIEAHGGSIAVASEMGKGTVFTIHIPGCVIDGETREAAHEPIRKLVNVLIADDDPDVRLQWRRIVQEQGGRIVHEADSAAAVKKAEIAAMGAIDTAIVDYSFEGESMTGVELAGHLKRKGVGRVYLCTGFHDDAAVRQQAHEAGVDGIIPKPVDPNALKKYF